MSALLADEADLWISPFASIEKMVCCFIIEKCWNRLVFNKKPSLRPTACQLKREIHFGFGLDLCLFVLRSGLKHWRLKTALQISVYWNDIPMLKVSMFGQQKGESHIPLHQHRTRFFQILCCLFSIRTSWIVLLGAIAVAMVCLSHFLSIAVQRNSHSYLGGGFNFFLNLHPYLGKFPILTHIFQLDWKPPTSYSRYFSRL